MIPLNEIHFDFIRSSGPGGQNVNKVSTSVQLRFNVVQSPSLSSFIKRRIRSIAGRKMTDDGVLIITANRFRSQDQNRQDAMDRLHEIIRKASIVPKKRKKTRPTLSSKKRRVESKRRRGQIKSLRRSKVSLDD